MRLPTYFGTVLLFYTATSAFSAEIEVMREYQSNPYKLAQDGPDSRVLSASIEHQEILKLANRKEIQVSAEANHDKLLDLSEGDSTFAKLRTRFINRYRFGTRSASLLFTADAGTKRAAYIDQRTSEPLQTSRGEDIRERFSYNFIKPSSEFTYRWNSRLSTGLFVAMEKRNYIEDYESLNLESLDYTEISVQPTLRYKTEATYSRAYVFTRERSYDDRMIDDVNGRNILGSTLALKLNGFGLSHSRELTKNWTIESALSGYKISDNGVGYTDSDSLSLSLASKHEFSNSRSFHIDGKCTRRTNEFARIPDTENVDFGRLRQGCDLRGIYEQPLVSELSKLKLRVEVLHGWEENTESTRSYKQWAFNIGVNYRW